MSKNEQAKKAYQLAYDYDLEYGACPQCVVRAIMEVKGEDLNDLVRASHSLAGGGGLAGNGTCGALAGGLLVLGHYYGRDCERFGKGRFLKSFSKGKELMDKFQAEYGDISCDWIKETKAGKKYDMWKAEEAKEFKEKIGTHCADLSGKVAQWVIELID